MMSLSQFRVDMFKCWNLMTESQATFEVYYRRKVYRIHVQATGERYTMPYKPRVKKGVVPTGLVETTVCQTCGTLVVSGICMSKVCPTNS